MGMRQNIKLVYDESMVDEPSNRIVNEKDCVYIYSHYDGGSDTLRSPLANKLRRALMRNERWDDQSYLARIIFSEVIKDDIDGTTGYGLSPTVGEEEYETIVVDMRKNTVNDISYYDFINNNF